MSEKEIIAVTTPHLPGYEIVKILGIVHGLTVRTRGVGGKLVAGIEGIFGGEVTAYTSECEKARRESLKRLIENAKKMGANAIVRVDFETSDILQGTATLFSAYGTAVIVKPAEKER
ncbi:YbjQ family protein [Candidatus Bathyarchaeota archaeon]|nr:MAG: YbjQ family protein [Candidatus Bathyarchaeota archaeon]HDN05673.1 YbjQ family protein [Candidatus Bathyarchaeota archaeon]